MSTPEIDSLEETRLRIHAQAEESRRANQALRVLASEVESATGTARSGTGDIVVSASVTGAITGLELHDSALDLDPSELASELKHLIAAAQRDAVATAAALSAAQLGTEHPLVAELSASANRFGPSGVTDLR